MGLETDTEKNRPNEPVSTAFAIAFNSPVQVVAAINNKRSPGTTRTGEVAHPHTAHVSRKSSSSS